MPHTIVDDPSAWTAESLKGKEAEYTYELTESDVKEILASTDKIKARIPATEEAVRKVKYYLWILVKHNYHSLLLLPTSFLGWSSAPF